MKTADMAATLNLLHTLLDQAMQVSRRISEGRPYDEQEVLAVRDQAKLALDQSIERAERAQPSG